MPFLAWGTGMMQKGDVSPDLNRGGMWLTLHADRVNFFFFLHSFKQPSLEEVSYYLTSHSWASKLDLDLNFPGIREESQCSGLGPPHNGGWKLHMKGVWFAYSHSRLSFYTNPVSSLPPFVQLWKIRGGITSLKRKWSIVFPRENSRRQKDRVVSTAALSWLAYTWKLFQNKPGVECKAAQAFHNCCVCCWNLSRSNGPKHADSLGLPCVFLSCVQHKETAEDFWKFVFGAIYTKAEVNYCRIVRIK